ncbi:uncharacterized protein proca1 [Trichomycterus rosablanca]|uniref:uncharacterized protein proca1 n=1 Tax=Trichomycterus rosablanca TaxID=2290929 RepID=UPI002F3603E7
MWAVFFLFLSYLDGEFSKAELSDLDADESIRSATVRRSKWGFTYPGTLWCGAGNIADNYNQLGEFAETDKCCRTHDHCPHVIHAFSSNYGFTNFKWHSISHCDCDNTLKQCLRAVNDTASRVVGQAFFNVIEVSCFEFSIEEQCVERHWYGVCKKYDKVPVALVKESVPYDFGGIEVIDALPIVPSKNKLPEQDEDTRKESGQSESTTQSSFSGSKSPAPEEPSLTNVVMAAEDFIKVLATVSTSQGSSAEEDKGETQSSDKKRKKNGGKKKKKSKKRRGKGKGKSTKQNAGGVSKADEGVAGAPSANTTEQVINKNFVEDQIWVGKNGNLNFNSVSDSAHPNKMMRDDHQRIPNERQVETTIVPNAKQKAGTLEQIKDAESVQLVFTTHIPFTITSRPRHARIKQRKRQRRPVPTSLPAEFTLHKTMADNAPTSTPQSSGLAGPTTHPAISPPVEAVLLNFELQHEKGSALTASVQNAPIVGTKRPRLRQRGGRKKNRKLSTPSSPTKDLATEEPLMAEPSGGSERLQPNPLETELGRSLTGISGDIRPKKRHPRLKGSGDRRRSGQSDADLSIMEDTIRPGHETRTITDTSTSTVSGPDFADTQASRVGASTGLFPYFQTITPSMAPLKTRTTKIRRSKASTGKKRRKNKAL